MIKKIITMLVVIILSYSLTFNVNAAAISKIDKSDDVIHIIQTDGEQQIFENQIYPNVDIYKITSLVNEEDDGLKLNLYIIIFDDENASIKKDNNTTYQLWFNTTDANYYLNYSNSINNGYIYDKNLDKYIYENLDVTTTKYSIHANYPVVGSNTTIVDFNGCIIEKKLIDNILNTYTDCIPDSPTNNGNNNSNNGDNGIDNENNTPDISLILMISTICMFVIFYRKIKSRKS